MHARTMWASRLGILVLVLNLCAPLITWDAATAAQSDSGTETPNQVVTPEATTLPTTTAPPATTPPDPDTPPEGTEPATATEPIATDVATEQGSNPAATATETPVPEDIGDGTEQAADQSRMQIAALEALATEVQLASPTVVPASCAKGIVTDWRVTMPADTAELDYTWQSPGVSDGSGEITFTLAGTNNLAVSGSVVLGSGLTLTDPLPAGWTPTEVPIPGILDALYFAIYPGVTCTSTIDPTITVNQGYCSTTGVATNSQVTASANGAGYTMSVDPDSPQSSAIARDWTVNLIVTDGYGFPPSVTGGNEWSFDGARAWKSYQTGAVNCSDATTLAVPGVVNAACVTGVNVDYQVILPADTDAIDYTWTSPASDGTGRVAGTIPAGGGIIKGAATVRNGHAFGTNPPGWTGTGDTREYSRTLGAMGCLETQSPVVTTSLATCVAGVLGTTQVTASAVGSPAGYTMAVSPTSPQPGDIARNWLVALTLDDGYAWPPEVTSANGWSRGGNQATKIYRTEASTCTTVSLAIPTVTGGSCRDGVAADYQVTLPVDTAGLDYSWVNPTSDGTTEVTATIPAQGGGILGLVQIRDGYTFGPMPDGWWMSGVGRGYTRSLAMVTCEATSNPVITVNPGFCLGAVVQPAQVTAIAMGAGYTVGVDPAVPQPGTTARDWTVTITIEPGYSWPPGVTTANGWAISGNQASKVYATAAVDCSGPVTPRSPTLVGGVCVSGVPSAYLVTLPADSDAIDYTWTKPASDGVSEIIGTIPPLGGVIQGTAKIRNGATFAPDSASWTGTGTTRSYSLTLPAVTCLQILAIPVVVPASCVNGVVTDYQVTFPADTAVFNYTWGPPFNDGSSELTVTYPAPAPNASISIAGQVWISAGYSFGPLPPGWINTSGIPAEYRLFGFSLGPVTCEVTTPAIPSVVNASCLNGMLSDYQVTLPADTDGIDYTWTSPTSDGASQVIGAIAGSGGTIQGTATIRDGYTFGANPSGWTGTSATRTYALPLPLVPCTSTTDPTITVTQGACVDTIVQPSRVTASANGAGYTMSVSPDLPQPSTIARNWTVTLTLETGHLWPPSVTTANEWTFNGYQATKVIETDAALCVEVLPTNPQVDQAACTGGEVRGPKVTLPDDTNAIDYSLTGTVAPGNTVIVTATLTEGFAWGDVTPYVASGWVFTATSGMYDVELIDPTCTPTVPIDPEVTLATCIGGQLLNPTLLLPAVGDALIYSRTPGNDVPGGTVTVTATLRDGFAWGDVAAATKAGWVFTVADATLVVNYDSVACEEVLPVAPKVVQELCINGVTTIPSVTPPLDTVAILYAMRGSVTPGDTVTMIATLQPGYGWGDTSGAEAAGWRFTTSSARLDIPLVDVSCTEAIPAIPVVNQAVCTNGVLSAPSVSSGPTTGIRYSQDPVEPYVAGQTVKVTAQVVTGYGWPVTLPDGWTRVDADTATAEVHFIVPPCPPATLVPTEPWTPTPVPTGTATETPIPTAPSTETPVPTNQSTMMPVPTGTLTETSVPTAPSSETPVPAGTSTVTPAPTAPASEKPVSTEQPVQTVSPTGPPAETPSGTTAPVSGLPDTGQQGRRDDHLPVVLMVAASLLLVLAWQVRGRTDGRTQ